MRKEFVDIRRCLESWEAELDSRAQRVRQLIGEHHWLSDGMHKEAILAEFLKRHLPRNINICRGFVVTGANFEEPSKEIDILVHDPILGAPWFSEGDLAIVSPASCLAQIHVKTEFSKAALENVLESCAHSGSIAGPSKNNCFFGAVFFEPGMSSSNEKLCEFFGNLQKKLPVNTTLPDVIVVIGGIVIVNRDSKLTGYRSNGLGLAVMLETLRAKMSASTSEDGRVGNLGQFLKEQSYEQIF